MSTLRKRRLHQPTEPEDDSAPLNLASVATIDYSSEDPAYPVEHLLDEHTGPGGSCWAAAQADTTEQLVLVFDRPQSVTRLVYEVEETERERTQEVHVEASTDAAERIPGAWVDVVEGAGHFIWVEAPGAVRASL